MMVGHFPHVGEGGRLGDGRVGLEVSLIQGTLVRIIKLNKKDKYYELACNSFVK